MAKSREEVIKHAKFVFRHVDPRYTRNEAELIAKKWPDYSYLSPFEQNLLFAKTYNEVRRVIIERDMDIDRAEKSKGLNISRLLHEPQLVNQISCCRQLADELGMPYPEYIHFCFDFAMRRTRRQLPYVNQMGPSEAAQEVWWAQFEKYYLDWAASLKFRYEHPAYLVENFQALPNQVAAKADAVDFIAHRSSSYENAIRTLVYTKRLVCLDDLKAVITAENLDRAVAELGVPPSTVQASQSGSDEWFLSCFGLQQDTSASFICLSCPLSANCSKTRDEIYDSLKQAGQMTRLEKERQKEREKKRKQRAQKSSRTGALHQNAA